MKFGKKVVSFLIIIAITIMVMGGCRGSDQDSSSENVNQGDQTTEEQTSSKEGPDGEEAVQREHAIFTVYMAEGPPEFKIEDTPIGKKVLENLNVTLEIEYLVGDKATKEGVLLASGDYPDIIITNTNSFIEGGAVIPLEDLIEEHGPNIKEVYSFQNHLEGLRRGDAHIYNISGARGAASFSKPASGMWIQKAVLKEFGWPKVTTLDEYFDLIEAYVEKYPTIEGQPTIGFDMITDQWRFGIGVMGPPKFLGGYQNDGEAVVTYDPATNTYNSKVYSGLDISKKYFGKLNEMYNKGLVDPEAFVMKYDQYIAKLSSGRVLGMHDWTWQFGSANAALQQAGMEDREFVALPIVLEEGISERYNTTPLLNANQGIMISTKAKDPARIIQFVNDLLSEENQKLLTWGEEGVDYSVDESGRMYRTLEQHQALSGGEQQRRGISNHLGYPFPRMSFLQKYSDGNYSFPEADPDVIQMGYTDSEREFLDAYGYTTFMDAFNYVETEPYGFTWSIQIPDDSEARTAFQRKLDLDQIYIPRAILANSEDFDGIWAEYERELGKINLDSYESFIDQKIVERLERQNPSLP